MLQHIGAAPASTTPQVAKVASVTYVAWEDEHNKFYKLHGLSRPLAFEQNAAKYIGPTSLSEPQKELAFLLCKVFPVL